MEGGGLITSDRHIRALILKKYWQLVFLAAVLAAVCTPALAHHSFAMFDRDKEMVLVGTVHDFQWTNPHSWIEVDVPNGKGGTEEWHLECNSPNNLTRQGWHSDSLKSGDRISVVVWPLRNGEKGGLFISLKFPDGRTLDEAAFRHMTKLPPGGNTRF
jgi:hypothetical protein